MNLFKRILFVSIATAGLVFSGPALAAPNILFLGVDKTQFDLNSYQGEESVRFSLIVSDSASKVAGAVLVDPVTQASYGTFQAGSNKSALQFDISVSDIVAVRNIDPFSSRERAFEVRVFNDLGEVVVQTINLTFNYKNELLNSKPANFSNFVLSLDESFFPKLVTRRVDRIIGNKVVRGMMKTYNLSLSVTGVVEDSMPLPSSAANFCTSLKSVSHFSDTSVGFVTAYAETCEENLQRLTEMCTFIGGNVTVSAQQDAEVWDDNGDQFVADVAYAVCSKDANVTLFESDDKKVHEQWLGF